MTLSRTEDLQLQTALLAQQLVELAPAARDVASPLLQQLTVVVREQSQRAPGEAPDPIAALRSLEIERLLGEASTLTHDEPRWRATLHDLRSALEAQNLVGRGPARADGNAAL
jgi:hypothetical protein